MTKRFTKFAAAVAPAALLLAAGATPAAAKAPAAVVIQEWLGLVPHIKGLADRFAQQGHRAFCLVTGVNEPHDPKGGVPLTESRVHRTRWP